MLLIGISGWVYKHWMDIFYPSRMPGEQQLAFYTQHFPTVEINYSFYRLPEGLFQNSATRLNFVIQAG